MGSTRTIMKKCMETDKKYSVLMTVHSGANPEHFRQAVDSMVKQTIEPEQFVISVDGELSEAHEKVICFYKHLYPEMFTILYNEKTGNWHAANKGLRACRNELIARMDSDDISFANRCEKELIAFQKGKVDIVGSYVDEFVKDIHDVVSVRKAPLEHEDIIQYAKRRNPFNHPTLMFRKSLAYECHGYKKMKRCEDYDFVVRMIMAGAHCKNIPESLLYYRLTEDTYERRKNWDNTKGFIFVRFLNWRRGFTSFIDFLLLTFLQLGLYFMPVCATKFFYQKILRRDIK